MGIVSDDAASRPTFIEVKSIYTGWSVPAAEGSSCCVATTSHVRPSSVVRSSSFGADPAHGSMEANIQAISPSMAEISTPTNPPDPHLAFHEAAESTVCHVRPPSVVRNTDDTKAGYPFGPMLTIIQPLEWSGNTACADWTGNAVSRVR